MRVEEHIVESMQLFQMGLTLAKAPEFSKPEQ